MTENTRTNAIDTTTLFDDVLKTSQSASQLGALRIYRVKEIPPDSFGRNGDIAIIDNTAFASEELASSKEPTNVALCQKVPKQVPSGSNTETSTANGADLVAFDQFSIDKTSLSSPVTLTLPSGDVFVKHASETINDADIEGIIASWKKTSSEGSVSDPYAAPGDSIIINGVTVTFTGGHLDHIVASINTEAIPYITAAEKDNHVFLTHSDGGTITVGGTNVGTIFGTGSVTGGFLTITNEDGFQVNLADVTGTPLATMSFPTTIAASSLELGGTWTCFGTSIIQVKDDSTTVGAFNILNFLGTGITSITDAGGGQVDINISASAASAQDLWETFNSDSGSSTATTTTDTFNVMGGTGIDTAIVGKTMTVTNTAPGPIGLTYTTINGQTMVTFEDPSRPGKQLTVSEQALSVGENVLDHLDWLRIGGNATDADSGFIADFDGTVTYATGHCENTNANAKDIHLIITTPALVVTDAGSIGTLSGGTNATFVNTTLNIDFNQGDRLRLQAIGAGSGNIQDTVAKITLKWRG